MNILKVLRNQRGNFGGASTPAVTPVNTAGEDANAARAAAVASQEEENRLKRERGAAGTILTGSEGIIKPKVERKTLLGE
jgi:hypothetical protein